MADAFKYSKIKKFNDLDFAAENFGKVESEIFIDLRPIFEDFSLLKQNIIAFFNNGIQEYSKRLKFEREISVLCNQQNSITHKLSELNCKLKALKKKKENNDSNRDIRTVHMYEQNLALRIENTAEDINEEVAVSFNFHNINESNPQETCSFVLIITDGNKYRAGNCQPPISGIDELISALNINNDLHIFTVNVRKKFKEYF